MGVILPKRYLAIGMLACGAAACDPTGCIQPSIEGIEVNFVDAAGGVVVTTEARVIATSGSFADTVRVTAAAPSVVTKMYAVPDRPGTYTVRVSAAGYSDWVQEGVRVGDNGCTVKQVSVLARLARVSTTLGLILKP